jgi:hypothetical protein
VNNFEEALYNLDWDLLKNMAAHPVEAYLEPAAAIANWLDYNYDPSKRAYVDFKY